MPHEFTVAKVREGITIALNEAGLEGDGFPVEVWTGNGMRELEIVDVVFDDGAIVLEVREVD